MANLQLERLAATPKAIQVFVLPPLPKFPEWFTRKFELEDWQTQMDEWRAKSQESIRDALKAVQSQN